MRKLSLLSLLALVSSLIPSPSLALSTSYDVFNVPDMFLNAGITESATTGIYLAAPRRNGAKVTYPTTSGGLLKFEQNGREELVAYNSATVDATTKVITLAGVTRNVCFNLATAFTSCGNGKIFTKGASVRLVNAAQLFNLKANIDRANTFTARNAIRFSGSGSLGQPTFATTAIRDQQLGASPASGSGLVACVVATGLCYDGLGGAWVARGANAVQNADTGVSGKVEIPTLAHMQNLTGTGSSGAQNVVPLRWVVKIGTGAITRGRVPSMNINGALDKTLGGLGSPIPSTSSGVLVTRGSGTSLITSSASGNFIRYNSKLFPVSTGYTPPVNDKTVYVSATNSTGTGASSTKAFTYDVDYTIPANELVSGVCYEVYATTQAGFAASYTFLPHSQLGTTSIGSITFTSGGAGTFGISYKALICGTTTAGASAEVRIRSEWTAALNGGSTASMINYSAQNFATNTALRFRFGGTYGTSDAGNSATQRIFQVRKISSTAF